MKKANRIHDNSSGFSTDRIKLRIQISAAHDHGIYSASFLRAPRLGKYRGSLDHCVRIRMHCSEVFVFSKIYVTTMVRRTASRVSADQGGFQTVIFSFRRRVGRENLCRYQIILIKAAKLRYGFCVMIFD